MQTVLLTGVTGFIGKHVALKLLQSGYVVRASLRSPHRSEEVRAALRPHLADPAALDTRLTFVTLDLERDEGWSEALQGVDSLVHTASPFPIVQPRDEAALIRPAVDGTLRALRAAQAAGVTRVVLTSSVAAIQDSDLPPGKAMHDESDWSDLSFPTISAYSKSKTMAERAAWDFVKTQAPGMRLTTINPCLVLGPPLDAHYGSSVSLVARILAGKDPMLPDIGFNIVDVRDIAEMHVRALSNDATVGERIIGAAGWVWFADAARQLKGIYPTRKVPSRVAPHVLIRMLALFDRSIRVIIPQLGTQQLISSAKAQRVMGMDFIAPATSIADTAVFLTGNKLV